METTFTLGDAIILAAQAHAGQKDKVGEDYILHPLRVMLSFESYQPDQRMVAVMHDVLEDTEVTTVDLFHKGVPAVVVEALVALKHENHEQYSVYIERVSKNELARAVKIADIRDNTSMERLLRLDQSTINRLLNKYTPALATLGAN